MPPSNEERRDDLTFYVIQVVNFRLYYYNPARFGDWKMIRNFEMIPKSVGVGMEWLSPLKGFLCRFNTAFLPGLCGKRKQAKSILPVDGAVAVKPGSEAIFALPPYMPFLFPLYFSPPSLWKHTLAGLIYWDLNKSLNNTTGICANR